MVKLIRANMRKDRNVLTAFLFVLILTSLLLHTGLFVGQYSSIYDEKVENTKEADVLSYIIGSDEDITKALSDLPGMLASSKGATAPTVNQTNNNSVQAPVSIQVTASGSDPEAVGKSVYDVTEQYLLRTLKGAI